MRRGKPVLLRTADQEDQVDNEKQHDGGLEDHHPAIGLVLVKDLVKVIEGFEFLFDRALPVRQMETGGDAGINAGEVPVAEEFGDIGQFIAELSQIDPQFAQFAQDTALQTQASHPQIAVGPLEGTPSGEVMGASRQNTV